MSVAEQHDRHVVPIKNYKNLFLSHRCEVIIHNMNTTKLLLLIIIALPIAVVIYFAVLGQLSKSDVAPGIDAGKLAKCPNKPNCVSSEYPDDAAHAIAPISYANNSDSDIWEATKKAIIELGGEIIVQDEAYLSAIFTSTLFGFVDDLECRLDSDKQLIHIRSGSRVGHSDFGVNKKRVEAIRKRLGDAAGAS